MKLVVEIECDNDAFTDGFMRAELACILCATADKVEEGDSFGYCRDVNGNKVGKFQLIEEDNQ